MKLSAKFIKLLYPLTGTSFGGTWTKQDLVVETKETYPKKVVLTNWNDKFDISKLKENSYYDFELLLESNASNGSYYSSAIIIDEPSAIQDNALSQITGFKLFQTKVKIANVSPEMKGTNWTKQEVLFEPLEKEQKSLKAFVMNNRVDLTIYSVGDEVNLEFYIESREYNQKWYTDFKVWKIELLQKGTPKEKHNYNLSDPDTWPF
jgi:hypothetical protein